MNYSRDHMEAACCLWEAMLESKIRVERAQFKQRGKVAAWHEAIGAAFEQHGTVAMRHVAIDLASACDKAWNALSEDEKDVPFDWDFCPAFIAGLDWTQWPPTMPTPAKRNEEQKQDWNTL